MWRGIVSVEAEVSSEGGRAAVDELDLALSPPFKTEHAGSTLLFSRRDWLWLTHSWDPFVYVSRGRIHAKSPKTGRGQIFQFDLHMGSWLSVWLLIAGTVLLFAPSPYGLPWSGLVLLGGLLWFAAIPRLFVAKVQRLMDKAA